jgi:hypothetical protein
MARGGYPPRRLILDGKNYEIWIVRYAGGGGWYKVLRPHHYYYITEAATLWSERKILQKLKSFPWAHRHDMLVARVEIPDGTVLEFPPPPPSSPTARQKPR